MPKLVFILKLNLILKLGFILKFVYIQNFELILNILEHLKPSMFSLKQPGRLVACYLEKTPLIATMMSTDIGQLPESSIFSDLENTRQYRNTSCVYKYLLQQNVCI